MHLTAARSESLFSCWQAFPSMQNFGPASSKRTLVVREPEEINCLERESDSAQGLHKQAKGAVGRVPRDYPTQDSRRAGETSEEKSRDSDFFAHP